MRNYNEQDIRFYTQEADGDFGVDESGDFALTTEYESARQDMANRIRTQKTDWRSHPNIGADLELLEGEPNTRETGEKGETQIYRTLTYDNRFDLNDLNVRAVPTSIEEIEFFSSLDTDRNGMVVVKQPIEL
ncbi:hypothetical protein FU976_07975 [Campylobacter jejuni]|nr:hypothetical protein [Campylobacter jejuni]